MTDALDQLFAARTERRAMDGLDPATRPADEAAAYALQARLHERLIAAGLGPLGGYKVGCTSAVMQRYLGIESPCAGGVLAPTVRIGTAELRHDAYVRVGVECELAVRLGRDITPDDAPHDRERVARSVEALMCAIEVVDDRWRDHRAAGTPSLIADDFFAAGCVLGEPCAAWRALDLERLEGRMTVNGEPAGSGHGSDILGDPLASLTWLANARASLGKGLERGRFVLLGSMVRTRWLDAGDDVEVSVERLGRVRARFVA